MKITGKKIAITIVLALAYWALMQYIQRDKVAGHSIADLEKHYAEANHQYFFDKLPKNTKIVLVPDLWDGGNQLMGDTVCVEGRCVIRINRSMNPAPVTLELTLDHEMCHIATPAGINSHGAEFQNCMMDLAGMGALRDIW